MDRPFKRFDLSVYTVAIGPVTGRPFPWLMVRQLPCVPISGSTQIASANQIYAFTSCCVASVD